MRQTRIHQHDESHYDTEELFGDTWAVTKCNCKLITKSEEPMSAYNGLNSIKTDLSKAGICNECGRRLTDPVCTHATPEQIEYTRKMDAEIDAYYESRAMYGKNWERDAEDLAALVDVVNASEPLDTVDAQLAHDWQDTPEYKEAHKASDNFNFDAVKETEF